MSAHQLLFFPEPPSAHARHSDPVTSHMAASVVNVGLSQMLVLSIMTKIREGTDEAIWEAINLVGKGNAISQSGARTRRKELTRAGLVRDSGRFGVTKSGNKSKIWEMNV